jgi:ParB family chromosome partitioning protein
MIRIDEIIPPRIEMRLEHNKQKVASLAKSISSQGLLHPIVVRKSGQAFEVIAGHRRLQAYKLLKRNEIEARVINATDPQTLYSRYAENMARKDVSPLEESEYLAEIQAQTGCKGTEIAKEICRSDAYVSERLAIQEWPTILKAALASGKISFSVAREFAKFPDENALRQFLDYALSSGCNPSQARRWRRMAQKASEDVTVDSGEIDDLPQELPPPPLLSYFGRYASYHRIFKN